MENSRCITAEEADKYCEIILSAQKKCSSYSWWVWWRMWDVAIEASYAHTHRILVY